MASTSGAFAAQPRFASPLRGGASASTASTSPAGSAGPAAMPVEPGRFTLRGTSGGRAPARGVPGLLRRRKAGAAPVAADLWSDIYSKAADVKLPPWVVERWKQAGMDERIDRFSERCGG